MMSNFWGEHSNETIYDTLSKELPKSSIYLLLISIVLAIFWVIYITYYNSRVLGLILSAILNRFCNGKYGHIKVGSFSFSVLSGKIMFRDVHIVTEDYSLRIQLGFAIFRWWRPLTEKKITDDLSQLETRLSVTLDSFEWHVYNRSHTYYELEKLFDLPPNIIPPDDSKPEPKSEEKQPVVKPGEQPVSWWNWRELIPVIKFEITSGRLVFGNHLLPTTLCITFRETQLIYTTKEASTPFDHFLNYIDAKVENLRVMLVKSPKYKGPYTEEAPRNMGDGFVVLQSNTTTIKYYFDEPGLVPYEPEHLLLADGEVVAERTWPRWGMDVKCHHGADISYGPWADRQREHLWKFFYPADYQSLQPTVLPEPGQRRVWHSFDFKMCMERKVTIDILFTKNTETQAIHMNSEIGSMLEFTIPHVVEEGGYSTKVKSMLTYLDATTSLSMRQLIECETFELDVDIRYPKTWNEHQDWRCGIIASKASGTFAFQHKNFFLDLIDDWSSKSRSDLLHFVPYTWNFTVRMREFELMTLANEWNWVDCNGQPPENTHIAVCGELFDLNFYLPFYDYLPPTVPLKFSIRGEGLDLRLYLPETNTSRQVVLALAENMKVTGRDGNVLDAPFTGQNSNKWRRNTMKCNGWVDCWTAPNITLGINYTYHPMPSAGDTAAQPPAPAEILSTPDAEERLLIPLRLVPQRPLRPKKGDKSIEGEEFDPTTLEADLIELELEVGPSVLCVYGSLLRNLWHVKENYLGEDQKPTDYDEIFQHIEKGSNFEHIVTTETKERPFDELRYRPLHVNVQVTLHDIQAHLVKNCSEKDPPCPSVYIERLGFELDKRYLQTRLQLLLSPAVLVATDHYQQRPAPHSHLQAGHLALSGLQVRGQAMFSHKDLPLDAETLEYAWLLEVTIGDLTGKLTASQLQSIIEFLQTFVFLIEDPENSLQRPNPYHTCQHGMPQTECRVEAHLESATTSNSPPICPTSDDIKYRMNRVSLDCVDLYLVEAGSALNIQIYPIRLATCNLHGLNNAAGITALIPHVNLRQYVLSVPVTDQCDGSEMWLEAGGVCLGPITVDAAMALPAPSFNTRQDQFLKLHDECTRQLWFMWNSPEVATSKLGTKCGCLGGCMFFGNNRNGSRIFQPSEQDFVDSTNAAVFHICTGDDSSLGFGQSILREGQLMFDLHSASIPVTPSKTLSLLRQQKPAPCPSRRPRTDTLPSVTDTSSTVQDAVHSDISIAIMEEEEEEGGYEELSIPLFPPPSSLPLGHLATVRERDERETASIQSSEGVPSEYLPGGSIPDAYDTDHFVSTPSDTAVTWVSGGSGSVSSLPDVGTRKTQRHERTHSYDPPRASASATQKSVGDNGESSGPGSISSFRRDSRGSIAASSLSRQSSLTSPVLRRLSSQLSVQREGSNASIATSVTGSDMFFSAPEDIGDSARTLPNSPLTLPPSPLTVQSTRQRTHSSDDPSSPAAYVTPSDVTSLREVDSMEADYFGPHGTLTRQRRFSSTSSTASESGMSFVSAVSSQHILHPSIAFIHGDNNSSSSNVTLNASSDLEQDLDDEDDYVATNYVDLHGQINQPITRSPLLMQCYTTHMTQLNCAHWAAPPPLPHITQKTVPSAPQTAPSPWIPEFSYIAEGFTPKWMVGKRELRSPPDLSSPHVVGEPTSKKFFPDSDDGSSQESNPGRCMSWGEDSTDFEAVFGYEDHVSKTTAMVNLAGSVDIMVSPLMLEALQRYVDAVTPVLAELHPSTIVDAIHLKCASAVKSQNKLKQQESDQPDRRDDKTDRGRKDDAENQPTTTETEEVGDLTKKTSRLQVMFSLSKINISLVQASLVEEVISIAALEHVKELTCVSVLAVCIDNINCQLLTNNSSQKQLEAGVGSSDCSPDSAPAGRPPQYSSAHTSSHGSQSSRLGKQSSVNTEMGDTEQVVETQQEDLVGSLHIGRIHAQLRRMKRDSNFSDNVHLTAIPEHRSKVLFSFEKQCLKEEDLAGVQRGASASGTSVYAGYGPRAPQNTYTTHRATADDTSHTAEDIAGFIMFECGLEDITLRAARRTGYEGRSNTQEDECLQQVHRIFQDVCSKTKFDDEDPFHKSETSHSMGGGKPRPTSCSGTEDSSSSSSSTGSQGNSADDEASNQSRCSIPSETNPEMRDEGEMVGDEGDPDFQGNASSCTLEFKGVWFNFAAPPPSLKKKKLEYTRLDWNLLSTVTPAINAWLNPSHWATVSARTLVQRLSERVSVIMACIMTEALDMPGIHMMTKQSRFNKMTAISRTLQEDPSCQLLTVLRHYIHKAGTKLIEANVHVDTVPQLLTLQKGLLVLTRQWKNELYMPRLSDTSFKSKKKVPYTVTFALPQVESVDNLPASVAMEDGEFTLDNYEVVDEKTSLLKAEGGSMAQSGSLHSFATAPQAPEDLLRRPASTGNVSNPNDNRTSLTDNRFIKKGSSSELAARVRNRVRGLGSIPLINADAPDSPTKPFPQRSNSLNQALSGTFLQPKTLHRNESNVSFASSVTDSAEKLTSVPGTPLRQSLTRHLSQLEKREDEDLYRWMQRQQEHTKFYRGMLFAPSLHYYASSGQDSLVNAGVSEYSHDDSISIQHLTPITHPALTILDAQVLFRPLLKAIGLPLETVKMSAMMKKFGGNISIKGVLQELRIDIIDSEIIGARKSKGRGKGRARHWTEFHIDTGFEMPAFKCDTFAVKVAMKDIVDFEKNKEEDAYAELGGRRKSLRALHLAMDQIEAKPTTTRVNFNVNCYSVTQHVNMSLLRLVYQFVTMIENIGETRTELKELSHTDRFRRHRKQDSKSSTVTGTDVQSLDQTDASGKPGSDSGDLPEDSRPSDLQLDTPSSDLLSLRSPPFEDGSSDEYDGKVSDSHHPRPDKLPLSGFSKGQKQDKAKMDGLPYSIASPSSETKPDAAAAGTSSHFSHMDDSVAIEMADTSSPALAEKTIVDEIHENTPKCWRTLYHLMNLYSTPPEPKTVGRPRPCSSKLSVIDEEPEKVSQTQSMQADTGVRIESAETAERQPLLDTVAPLRHTHSNYRGAAFTHSFYIGGERVPLVAFGLAKVKRIRISALLSGLSLEANLQNVHGSATHRERVKGVPKRRSRESSATAHVGHTMIVLLEGTDPDKQTVVTVNIAKSQGLYSAFARRSKEHNAGLLTIGRVDVDIPQHPVVLHGMVARGSKRLSTTLQEFIRPQPKPSRSHDTVDSSMPTQQTSRHSELNEATPGASQPTVAPQPPARPTPPPKPLIIHYKATLQGLTIGASLLPSLKAQYEMGEVFSSGVTGKKAKFTIDLPSHSLSFTSKVHPEAPSAPQTPYASTPFAPKFAHHRAIEKEIVSTPSNLPSSASIALPPIHLHADYREHIESEAGTAAPSNKGGEDTGLSDGLSLRPGKYLNAVAEVGAFEHSLTTDLLNHLVFVQKVFMKEVNELVQKVSGADQPVPLWVEDMSAPKALTNPLLYQFLFRLKGIQITATTPTHSAVRLETDLIELELSNRVLRAGREGPATSDKLKVFIKAQVNLNVSLGTLLKNILYEEAEVEFTNLASFATKINLRNALQDEMIPGVSKDQEALLISLKRPTIFVQPAAFDKAVLVWLNYKNAYDYWTEQRMALNKEAQTTVHHVLLEKLQVPLATFSLPGASTSSGSTSAAALGTLFLQLTVDDLGICLPINPQATSAKMEEAGEALVLTLDRTQISACSCGSLVSKGKFTGFCLRIDDDFQKSWDEWRPIKNPSGITMNAMVVPEGTYEVCSRTSSAPTENTNAKWILNVKWQMRGIEIHLNTNIGKRLNVLGNTLTSLAGEQLEAYFTEDSAEKGCDTPTLTKVELLGAGRKSTAWPEGLPEFVYDPNLDARTKARLIETEMNNQAKVVEDLKQLGASHSTIETEERKLAELEAAISHDFRQDIMKRLKRQGVKANAIKDKLGLGYKPAHMRSKSVATGLTGISPGGSRSHPWKDSRKSEVRRLISFAEESESPNSPTSPMTFQPGHARTLSLDVNQLGSRACDVSPRSLHSDLMSTTIDDPTCAAVLFEDSSTSSPISPNSPPYRRLPPSPGPDSSSEEELAHEYSRHLSHRARSPPRSSQLPGLGGPSSGSLTSVSSQKAAVEPSVDFEMDIKVNIDSGSCVLHPKDSPKDPPDTETKKGSKKNNDQLLGSPRSERKKSNKKINLDNTARTQAPNIGVVDSNTVFFLPGLDVKVHYTSKTSSFSAEGSESPSYIPPPDPLTPTIPRPASRPDSLFEHTFNNSVFLSGGAGAMGSGVMGSGSGVMGSATGLGGAAKLNPQKKANLYAWVSLQKLPEEMLISPALLDFLEQALEPIPLINLAQSKPKPASPRPPPAESLGDLDTSTASLAVAGSYASFPVDVVVYISVQPSLIRFTCLPVSRVECLLRLPSLDVVFSTKKADMEDTYGDGTPPVKNKGSKRMSSSSSAGSLRLGASHARTRTTSGHQTEALSGGGLSVTGCLSDFSLYVFHPYGGGQKKTSLQALENTFRKTKGHGINTSTLETGRKDSLSLNVEFVKVNISRSRRGVLQGDATASNTRPTDKPKAANIVRFSAICDIGSASFKYDMRRLSEILALPKAWYRRTLARRMFLGEETALLESDEEDPDEDILSSSPPSPDTSMFSGFGDGLDSLLSGGKPRHGGATDCPRGLDGQDTPGATTSPTTDSRPQSPGGQASYVPHGLGPAAETPLLRFKDVEHLTRPQSQFTPVVTPGQKSAILDWETLVLFAVNLSQLDVAVNMSNVMGNTVWSTKDLKSDGRLSIDSTGYKNMMISAGLGGSQLEARGGIVGGNIELQQLLTSVSVREDPGREPEHRAGGSLQVVEARLDYMGSSVLMGRFSALEIWLSDQWKLAACHPGYRLSQHVTRGPASIHIAGDLTWDKLHLMISRSTTPDLIKMGHKVEEFFTQQLTSGKRVLSAFGPIPGSSRLKHRRKESHDGASWISEIRHHRHWQRVLEHVSGCKLSMMTFALPETGSEIGGTLSLKGHNLTLACFHGINFRSKSWALFTMAEPDISFSTQALDYVDDEGVRCTRVQQSLEFRLGHDQLEIRERRDMAMVCKLSRGHYMPPPFTSVQDWFNYAFSTSEVKDLGSFPQMTRQTDTERRSSTRRGQEYMHDTEVVFVLPRLQMNLNTRHLQGEQEPEEGDPKPIVECSFVTDFEDHIHVAMDAEVIFFLHDLVTNYVKEKDRGTSRETRSPEAERKTPSNPTAVLKQDFREFNCSTWKLEPTVRLISWGGKKIDPAGVDYILQKLGFQHARLTIPKWMQRGCMDPLDKVLSVLVDYLILLLRDAQHNQPAATADHSV